MARFAPTIPAIAAERTRNVPVQGRERVRPRAGTSGALLRAGGLASDVNCTRNQEAVRVVVTPMRARSDPGVQAHPPIFVAEQDLGGDGELAQLSPPRDCPSRLHATVT
jgi:hypothetical protein